MHINIIYNLKNKIINSMKEKKLFDLKEIDFDLINIKFSVKQYKLEDIINNKIINKLKEMVKEEIK